MGLISKKKGKEIVDEIQSKNGYLRRQIWTHPVATLATLLTTAEATSASVTTVVTSFSAQPDFARKITVTPGGTTTDVAAGDVTVVGTNIRGESITDTITFSANASTVGATSKAFKTVTSVTFPIQDGAGATFDIGVNDALGLDRCMSEAAVVDAYTDGVRETTAATVTYNATDVSKNTADFNTALANTKVFVATFVATETTTKNGTSS